MAAKKSKIFYTTCLGQGSAEFVLVEHYAGQGIYIGKRYRASEEQLALYHEQLKADNITVPSSDCFVTVMRPVNQGDVVNDNCTGMRTMFEVVQSHLEADYKKRKPVPNDSLCYVGKDFAGRLDKLRPMLNGFDRKIIREGLADTILSYAGVGHRWALGRYQLQLLRDLSGRM